MWNVYASGHVNSLTVAGAFAEGAGLPFLIGANKLMPGGMVTYGNLRGLKPLLDKARAEGRQWIYIDNGYFKPGHFEGYYRVTLNAYQHDGSGKAGVERLDALGIRIRAWRTGGTFVMVCPPSAKFGELHGFDAGEWLKRTLTILKKHTDRKIIIRAKPGKAHKARPFREQLDGCHALVTHSSNVAVEALVEGVPVFCTASCAALAMGSDDLTQIERPVYHTEREQWARNLAANQWTLDEMRRGDCWRALCRQMEGRMGV